MADAPETRGALARQAGQSVYRTAIDVVLTGIVVIVPLVITLYVLTAALNFITSALNPFIRLLEWAGLITGIERSAVVQFLIDVELFDSAVNFLTELIAVFVLGVLIVVLGLLARFQYGEQVIDTFDYLIASIPGVGSVYQGFRRMGDAVLESGTDNFREVKLVEFPHDDVYVLGFETSTSPLAIQGAAGEVGMVTLFLPLAPNPVMGGFLAHVPEDRVRDVDMTVEEAVQTIITSGIAAEEPDGEYRDLSPEEIRELTAPDRTAADRDAGDGRRGGG